MQEIIDSDSISDLQAELEYKCRRLVKECRKVESYSLRENAVVLRIDGTSVGLLDAPIGFHDGAFMEYAESLGFSITRVVVQFEDDFDPADSVDVVPADVGSNHTTESADMQKIRRKWLREHMYLYVEMTLEVSDLA